MAALLVVFAVVVAICLSPFVFFGNGLLASEESLLREQAGARRAAIKIHEAEERALALDDARERRMQRRVRQAASVFIVLPLVFAALAGLLALLLGRV